MMKVLLNKCNIYNYTNRVVLINRTQKKKKHEIQEVSFLLEKSQKRSLSYIQSSVSSCKHSIQLGGCFRTRALAFVNMTFTL